MAETGVIKPDARVELLDGQIIDMMPIGPFHGGTVNTLIQLFSELAKKRYLVSAQNPVRLNDHSEPEPDLMLLKPKADNYKSRHPKPGDVFLIIEVADSTLEFDREEKIPAYGAAGISEAWLVNLPEQKIEVYREPHYTGYGSKTVLRPGEKAQPSAFPDVTVDVAELLRQAG
ncbi:MAG: Uma2 family endonuclease [Gemmataceae bacterium]|nr:Uma2 family endonuclease [Gemmataceae bacterium]